MVGLTVSSVANLLSLKPVFPQGERTPASAQKQCFSDPQPRQRQRLGPTAAATDSVWVETEHLKTLQGIQACSQDENHGARNGGCSPLLMPGDPGVAEGGGCFADLTGEHKDRSLSCPGQEETHPHLLRRLASRGSLTPRRWLCMSGAALRQLAKRAS